jgi:putative Mn2+ efflux pump MntP
MGFLEVLLLGVALSMDACAVGMTNGMTDTKMPLKRVLLIALFFGFFQFLMPLIGYFVTGIFANAFLETFEKISAWISFVLLAFLGGKMILDCVLALRAAKDKPQTDDTPCPCHERLTIPKLCAQAIATSIDALAVGVTLQMAAISGKGLLLGAFGSTGVIGVTTFLLTVAAVYLGKAIGNKLADKASFFGGVVLIGIGVKLLIEGLL